MAIDLHIFTEDDIKKMEEGSASDENNFSFKMKDDGFHDEMEIEMKNGLLYVNDCLFEDDHDNPIYSMAREIARRRRITEKRR